jgi:acetyl esterase/lipase
VTVTAAALGGVPTAEITIDGIEPRHVVLYFHGGVYVIGDAFQAAGLAAQVGRRTGAKVISVDYRLAPEHPYPAAVDDTPVGASGQRRTRHRLAKGRSST